MKINTTQIAAFFLLVFSVTAGSTIYAIGKVNALNAALTLPTPAPLTNRPTIPPPSPSQISRDFLDHSIPRGYGIIKGKVIDDGTGAALEDARITIPELKLATRSNKDGNFAFDPIQVGTSLGAELDITLEAQVPGYGKHSMVNVGVFSQDTATVLLALKKGTAATNWFGLAKKGHDNAHAPLLLSNFSAPAGSLYFGPLTFTSSATSPPPYIRIGIMPLDSSGTQTSNVPLRVDSVDFNFYMKHVLGSEWYSTYSTESLKAGAMAVKNYGWYHVINPKAAMVPYGADCQNSTYCQVYNPYISYSSTDQAIDAMSTTGWYQNGAIFESGYCGGGASSGTSVSACGYEVNKMSQYGSNLWANPPYNESYSQILSYYYSASGTISYFSYHPNPPLIFVASSDTSTITFNYSSASSVDYEIWKWVNNSWMLQYGPGTATSWTDSLLTGGTAYTYAAYAQSPDGIWWSGAYPNGGYITAIPGVPSSLKSPITDAFFVATSTVRISATSTTANIDEWAVDKYSTTSGWFSVYSNWPDAVSATSGDATSTNPFPKPAYRDFTRWEGTKGGDGRFVYVDTGLTANTQYYYTVAYHTPAGWSDWSNHNGSVDPFTDQSN